MPFALLTETNGTFALPVVGTVQSAEHQFTVNGRSYNLRSMDPANRAALGWFDFLDTVLDRIYVPGVALDTLANDVVSRTYPNKTLKDADFQKADRIAEIEARAHTVAYGGMVSAVNDSTDALTLSSHGLIGHTTPAVPDQIRSIEGVLLGVNTAEYRDFADAMAQHVSDAQKNSFVHIDAVNALSDPQAIVDYDISGGWPANPA